MTSLWHGFHLYFVLIKLRINHSIEGLVWSDYIPSIVRQTTEGNTGVLITMFLLRCPNYTFIFILTIPEFSKKIFFLSCFIMRGQCLSSIDSISCQKSMQTEPINYLKITRIRRIYRSKPLYISGATDVILYCYTSHIVKLWFYISSMVHYAVQK